MNKHRIPVSAPRRVGRTWLFADGSTLPVVSGGATEDADPEATDKDETAETADITAVADADLQAREDELIAEYDALRDADGDDADVAKLTAIADELDTISTEKDRRAEEATKVAADRQAQADRVEARKAARAAEAATDGDDDGDDEDDDDGDDPGDGAGDKGGDDAGATKAKEKELVSASAAKFTRPAKPSASATGKRSPKPSVDRAESPITITASADAIPNVAGGAFVDMGKVAQGFHQRAKSLRDGGKASVATINLTASAEVISDKTSDADALDIINRATDPSSLDLTSLTASGGWCTPSETMFDLFGLDGATGLLSIPSITITRGGINVPGYIGIDSADGALWTWTEDQDSNNVAEITTIARVGGVVTVTTAEPHSYLVGQTVVVNSSVAGLNGVVVVASVPTATTFTYALAGADVASAAATGTVIGQKHCFRIPCPEWTDYRLAALGYCFEHGNMTDRSFPELGRRYLELVVNAHLHAMSATQVAQIITAHSVPVTIPAGDSDAYGDLMSAIELQVADYRSEHGISDSVILEVLLPVWTLAYLRSNLAKRQGVDLLAVTDQQLAAHFATRSVRPQFLEDYQSLHDGTPATAWPTEVQFVLYPAGGFFLGNGGTIELGPMRDSMLNATNDFTLAWTEQFWLLGRRGPLARAVTVPVVANGVTGCCEPVV